MLGYIKSLFQAATTLEVVAPPKVKRGPLSLPTFLKTAKPSPDTALLATDRRLTAKNITDYQGGASTQAIVRDFAASSPDLSAAVSAYLRLAITDSYTAVAKAPDGTFDPVATLLVQQILTQLDFIGNYQDGFSGTWSIRSVAEALGKEIVLYGACAAELVLGKTRLPSRIQPLSVTSIKLYPKDGMLQPKQFLGGLYIDLDIPTFFMVALDQDLLEAYPASTLEPALKAVVFSETFLADLQRVVRRAVHPRTIVTVDEDRLRKGAPSEALNDPDTLITYFNSVISGIETKLNGLNPEDALVLLNSIEVEYANNGNISLSKEYETLQAIINAKLSTGAKVLPAVLGHGNGTSNAASTESLLFMKSAAGAVQFKLNEMFSRMLTLGVRLFGYDVVVDFKFAPIDLRPEVELESFKSVKQARILEQLSLGLISDEEACISLTGKLPPPGYVKLAGTMFKGNAAQDNANPNGESNGGSTLNKNLNADAPTGVKGQNKKSDPQKIK